MEVGDAERGTPSYEDGLVTRDAVIELQLLGRFGVRTGGEHVEVAPSGQRVLACIALCGGVAKRARIAATLWPDHVEPRAAANLRGAVYRLPELLRPELVTQGSALGFSPRWTVDVTAVMDGARQLRDAPTADEVDHGVFAQDLLPDWIDDDWLIIERERHRQMRLHALEDLAEAQLAAARPLDAVDTALRAVSTEPLRESAQLLLLRAHLMAGNRAAATRQFRDFWIQLRRELRVDPSPTMQGLMASAGLRTGGRHRS
jgi:DNA-binding SARP family transcriptional activator